MGMTNFVSQYAEEEWERLEPAFTALDHHYLNLSGDDKFEEAFISRRSF